MLQKPSLDLDEPKTYRPIANLPFLSKSFVFHQLASHLTTHNLLSTQSAQHTICSASTSLLIGPGATRRLHVLRILNDLSTSLDEDKMSILLLLDLSAAFDTIDHEIIPSRLEHVFRVRSKPWIGLVLTCLTGNSTSP